MSERKVLSWCMVLLSILIIGVFVMANPIFVVWPEEVLEKHGYVRPITYGELINASERIRLSPSQIAAFESGPQRQGSIPGIVDILRAVRPEIEREGGAGGHGGMIDRGGEIEGGGGGRGGMTERGGEVEGGGGGRGGMISKEGEGESPSTRQPPSRRPRPPME